MRLKKEEHPKIVISSPQALETKPPKREVSKSPSPARNAAIKHHCDSEEEDFGEEDVLKEEEMVF